MDDEPLARTRLRSLLSSDPEISVIGECESGTEAVEVIHASQPDLVFLDVQMPGLDGFGVLDALASGPLPAIIFATAFDQYAVDAFDAHAVDYLLKPFRRERVQLAVARVKERKASSAPSPQSELQSLAGSMRVPGGKIPVRNGARTVLLSPKEILWLEASANYVTVCTADAKLTTRSTLGAIIERLPENSFLRVHRSYVINVDHMRELIHCGSGEAVVVMSNKRELPVGKTYKEQLEARLSLN